MALWSFRWEPSSLYTFPALARASLGVTSKVLRGFADFDSWHLPRFRDSARLIKTGAFNRSANLPYCHNSTTEKHCTISNLVLAALRLLIPRWELIHQIEGTFLSS